jgi:uncharacterized protein (DUF4415 family)
MSTAAKTKKRSKTEAALEVALSAEPKDVKVHLSMRLDLDIYRELKRRAKAGEAGGKYQSLLNDLLREVLFNAEEHAPAMEGTVVLEKRKLWEFLSKMQDKRESPPPKRDDFNLVKQVAAKKSTLKRASR